MRNFNPEIAHVVYAADNKYAEIFGVSLVSLYENSKDMKDIRVYVFDSGIKEENINKLNTLCEKYHRSNLYFIKTDTINNRISMNVKTDRGSLSQYARLFISSDLPENIDRVIYLDCDTIFNDSVKELWNLDLQGKTIGALLDAFSNSYRINIDLKKNDVMFNSGVMVIDLKQWKEKQIEQQVVRFIVSKNGNIQQADQGALNAVLSQDTYCFHPKFNAVTIFFDFTYGDMMIYRKPPVFYTEKQVEEAVMNPVIIHFTTSIFSKRAWMKNCKHQYVEKWLTYKEISPWKDAPLWDDNRPKWKQMLVDISEMLPRIMRIRIAGIMQAYVRPIKNYIVYKITSV